MRRILRYYFLLLFLTGFLLFPLSVKADFYPFAPVLTDAERQKFANEELDFIRVIYPRYINASTDKGLAEIFNRNSADDIANRQVGQNIMMSFLDKKD